MIILCKDWNIEMEKLKRSDKQLINEALIKLRKEDVDSFIKLISKFVSQRSVYGVEKENKNTPIKETEYTKDYETSFFFDSLKDTKIYKNIQNNIKANEKNSMF